MKLNSIAASVKLLAIASATGTLLSGCWGDDDSPSNTLPSTRMRSPDASGVTRLLLKASFQSYLPFEVRP